MKPAPFAYFAPESLEDALTLIAAHADDAKLLAGGQSLIPAMNFRLAQPAALVDLNRVHELDYLFVEDDGSLRIGAMTRQRHMERSHAVRVHAPLLYETLPHIAHVQIRNRGTIGGSLAHADPAAELPAVAVALDAQLVIASVRGERGVAARDFFVSLFTTDLAHDEVLVEVMLPPLPQRTGTAFVEFARRSGDYALAGCAAVVTLDGTGVCQSARLVYMSVGDMPVAATSTDALVGEALTPVRIADAARAASHNDIAPLADMHASAAYRRHLAEVLGRRALALAATRAASTTQSDSPIAQLR